MFETIFFLYFELEDEIILISVEYEEIEVR